MFRILLILTLFLTSSFAIFSLLSPMQPYFQMLNQLVTQRSNYISNKINSMTNGVISDIGNGLKIKAEKTKSLQALSQEDYKTNKEFLFLVQKLNALKEVSVDLRNAATGTLNTMDNFSTKIFNKVSQDKNSLNIQNIENSDIIKNVEDIEDLNEDKQQEDEKQYSDNKNK